MLKVNTNDSKKYKVYEKNTTLKTHQKVIANSQFI